MATILSVVVSAHAGRGCDTKSTPLVTVLLVIFVQDLMLARCRALDLSSPSMTMILYTSC